MKSESEVCFVIVSIQKGTFSPSSNPNTHRNSWIFRTNHQKECPVRDAECSDSRENIKAIWACVLQTGSFLWINQLDSLTLTQKEFFPCNTGQFDRTVAKAFLIFGRTFMWNQTCWQTEHLLLSSPTLSSLTEPCNQYLYFLHLKISYSVKT